MALQEWRSGVHVPFDAYLIQKDAFGSQCSVIREILEEFEESYPLIWKVFMDEVHSSALALFLSSHTAPEAADTPMDWGFSW